MKINYTQSDNFLSVFIDGKIFVIQRTDSRYNSIAESLSKREFDLVHRYVDPTIALNLKRLTVKDSLFFWDGKQLPDNFYQIFLVLVSKNRSLIPYLHFVLDNMDSPRIRDNINLISRNYNSIIPLDLSCKFFVTRSAQVRDTDPSLFRLAEDDSIGDIQESTYLDHLESKYRPHTLSFLKKEKSPDVSRLAKLHAIINSFDSYTKEDVQWGYEKLAPLMGYCNLLSIIVFFKTFERFKNWVNNSTSGDIKEVSDHLRIDGILEFADELFKRSSNFRAFSKLLADVTMRLKFKSQIIEFKLPLGLRRFSYTFYHKKKRYEINFARSNYEIYAWGLEYHNCAAGYTKEITSGNSLVFIIEVDGNKEIIGELVAVKRDLFVGKINGKTRVRRTFDYWRVNQFQVKYSNETLNFKEESIKMLKQIGLYIK